MKKNYILVIDSGIGGVSILKELTKSFPNENFIYVADNLNAPYGNKSKKFLCEHILILLNNYLKKYSIKLIIFACNTLTATSIKYCRKFITVDIVGTEPPIKQVKNNKKTLVLATYGTVKNSMLLKKYKNNKQFVFVGLQKVANLLDTNFYNRMEIEKELKNQIPKNNYKNVVLGCTHYYFLEREIYKVVHKVKFYNAIKGIIKQVKKLLIKNKINQKQSIKIVTTKKNLKLKNTIKEILNLK